MATRITGVDGARTYLQSTGRRLGNDFQKGLIERTRKLALKMQSDLDAAIDKGPVPFTHRALIFTFKKRGRTQITTSIIVKDLQAKYLYDVIVERGNIEKFVPTSAVRLTKQGNISRLKANITSGRYKIVKGKNGKERLIDTTKKDTNKKTKRVIGLRELKRRKLIYDFYEEAEKGTKLMLSDIQGTFTLTRG